MNRAPFEYYNPKESNHYLPNSPVITGKKTNNPTINTRHEDSLDTFRKEQQLLSKSSVMNRSEPYLSSQRDVPQYSNSATLQNNSSPLLSNGKTTGEISTPSRFYNKAFDQTNKYETNTTGQLQNLNYEIVSNQRRLEKSIEANLRSRSYNILSNQSAPNYSSSYVGNSYGSALKALLRNQEDTRRWMAQRGGQANNSFAGGNRERAPQYQETRMQDGSGLDAGKSNYYGETDFRYANRTMNPAPLNQEQMYGIRALKNLSGVKLY